MRVPEPPANDRRAAEASSLPHRGHVRRHRRMVFARRFLIVACVLTGARVSLPHLVKAYGNHVLAGLEGYHGRIGDIDIDLWRGRYALVDLRFEKVNGEAKEPFVTAPALELEIQWGGLLRGQIVTEAIVHQPRVAFVLAKTEAGSQTGADSSWAQKLDALLPFRVNRFAVRDGEIRYRDETTEPNVDFFMTDLYLEALGISNVRTEKSGLLPAEVEVAGRPFGTGEFECRLRFDPLADPLRFELDAEIRKVELTDLNDYLRAYGSVDAEAGTLGVFAEFAAADGRLDGYVKTLIAGLALARFGEIENPADAFTALWDAVVGLVAEAFENQPRDRIATVVPVSGSLAKGVDVDVLGVVAGLLRNSFVVALRPALNDDVEVRDLVVGDERQAGADLVRRANLSQGTWQHRAASRSAR